MSDKTQSTNDHFTIEVNLSDEIKISGLPGSTSFKKVSVTCCGVHLKPEGKSEVCLSKADIDEIKTHQQ